MTNKQKFNKIFGFDPNTSHNFKSISDLTGIPEKRLNTYFQDTIIYPNTSGYANLDKSVKDKMTIEMYAWSRLYYYSLTHKQKTTPPNKIIEKTTSIPPPNNFFNPPDKLSEIRKENKIYTN